MYYVFVKLFTVLSHQFLPRSLSECHTVFTVAPPIYSLPTFITLFSVPPATMTVGGPTLPLAPITLAKVPRTGPLGDGSPLTPDDTLLTINWIDKLASVMNLTNTENEAYETLLGEDLIQILADAMADSDIEIIEVGDPAGKHV